jgi:hypothetical protein
VVVTALVLVLALASALILTSIVETRIAFASRDAALVLSAANTAAYRVLIDLRGADWNAVLAGAISTLSDGPPNGPRALPDGSSMDLGRESADLQCGQSGGCGVAETMAVAEGRPWGSGNPWWRLFAYGPAAVWLPDDPAPPGVYLVAWVADDPTETDGDPFRDGVAADNPGRQVMLIAGRAYGAGGATRTVQLVVERVGTDVRVIAHHERPR